MANLAYLQITRNCNQKCRFCSNPPTSCKDLELTEIKKIIRQFIEKKYEGIILTGGEPTLHKNLIEIIKYCRKIKFPCRIITNGQKTSEMKYLNSLIAAGLKHFHISIYSHFSQIQAFLTQNKDSLKNIKLTLEHLKKFKEVRVDINITINKYNANHLSKLVKFIVKKYPFVSHFIFNNLDPTTERVKENPDTIPKLNDFLLELNKALQFLEKNQKTFRVERVPLCYLPNFEFCSTETRKIVKKEVRPVYFLDKRRYLVQKNFIYQKGEVCQFCTLTKICAGLYQMDKFYSSKELYPVFLSHEEIKKIIKKIYAT